MSGRDPDAPSASPEVGTPFSVGPAAEHGRKAQLLSAAHHRESLAPPARSDSVGGISPRRGRPDIPGEPLAGAAAF